MSALCQKQTSLRTACRPSGQSFAIVSGSGPPEWYGGPRSLPVDWGRQRSAGEDMQDDHPDALRELAAECVALAERTHDPVARVELLIIAQKWITMANTRVAVDHLSDQIRLAPK